jgi:hypothetical protein
MHRTIRNWESAGLLWILLAGSAAHFAFAWTGYPRLGALLFAVNESVWEHLKLAFWPAFILACVEFPFLRPRTRNFWAAKGLALWIMPLTIVVLFYSYRTLLGRSVLPLDITIFALAAGLGQWASYRVLTGRQITLAWRVAANVGLVVLVLCFSLLTYYPPRLALFEDSHTHTYGIPNHNNPGQ